MCSLTAPAGEPPTVVPPDGGRRVVLLAGDAAELDPLARMLRVWRRNGHTVVLAWRDGAPADRFRSFKARRRIPAATLPRSPRAVAAGLRDGSLRRRVRGRGTLVEDLRADAATTGELRRADAVVLVGRSARAVRGELTALLHGLGTPLVPAAELAWWKDVLRTWRTLQETVDEAERPTDGGSFAGRLRGVDLEPHEVAGLRQRLDLLGEVPAAQQEALAAVVTGLHRAGEHRAALDLAGHLRWEGSAAGADHSRRCAAVLRRGLAALVRTAATGEEAPDLQAAAAALLRSADIDLPAVLAADEHELDATARVVEATTLALELLFHRELHADGLSSPLVEDPDGFLAPWRASAVGQLLGSASAPLPAVRDTRDPHGPLRVAVSPGTFPKFAAQVSDALAELADVRELDLSSRLDLRWLGVSQVLVERRLRHALGRPTDRDLELLEHLEGADALFVDWADRAAVDLVMNVPAGRAVTVRIHSMDALSAWVHLVDWSRVGDLVLVSEHLRVVVTRILGERLRHTRVHVVPNVVDLSRIAADKTEGHRRRLLMTGWAQRVKDPVWALEILAALRQHDPRWELTLLGADFLVNTVTTTQDYAREFWSRLVQDDVRDAVHLVGFTDDVGPLLARSGFILSTSRRESFGLGLVEGAVSGCVPVVRDWPVFVPVHGARGLFPRDWVVGTVEQAVGRILSTCEEPAWSRAAQAARDAARQRFDTGSARAQLQQVVLGDLPGRQVSRPPAAPGPAPQR